MPPAGIYIDATTGNLGIGTAAPRQYFDVQGGNAIISGNVGIGTTNPSAILHITSGKANLAPVLLTAGTNLTTAVAGTIEYDGTNAYITPNINYGRAIIPATLYTSGAGTGGITLNTNYALFPAANDTITLPIGTYLVKLAVQITVTSSIVSSALTINIRGAGTAIGNFSWRGVGAITTNGATNSYPVAATTLGTVITVTDASVANPRQYVCIGEGILKITTGGTIIPSYQWPATLTSGIVTLFADNYMIIQTLDTRSTAAFGPLGCGFS